MQNRLPEDYPVRLERHLKYPEKIPLDAETKRAAEAAASSAVANRLLRLGVGPVIGRSSPNAASVLTFDEFRRGSNSNRSIGRRSSEDLGDWSTELGSRISLDPSTSLRSSSGSVAHSALAGYLFTPRVANNTNSTPNHSPKTKRNVIGRPNVARMEEGDPQVEIFKLRKEIESLKNIQTVLVESNRSLEKELEKTTSNLRTMEKDIAILREQLHRQGSSTEIQMLVTDQEPRPFFSRNLISSNNSSHSGSPVALESVPSDDEGLPLCLHFLRGKCRQKNKCPNSHNLTSCIYCGEKLPSSKVSASAHLSRCWKEKGGGKE